VSRTLSAVEATSGAVFIEETLITCDVRKPVVRLSPENIGETRLFLSPEIPPLRVCPVPATGLLISSRKLYCYATPQLTASGLKRHQKKTLPRIYMPALSHAYIEADSGPQRSKNVWFHGTTCASLIQPLD
jgi:hypothetical protein